MNDNIEIVDPTEEEAKDFADAQRAQALRDQNRNIKNAAKRMVWVTFAFEGIHKYPAAADTEGMEDGMDVSFLAHPHRHMFHFRVGIEIFHNDRDIEFIQFKRFCERQFTAGSSAIELNNNSVEMLSDALFDKVAERHPHRDITIEVSEDLENGCRIEYKQSDWLGK